MLPTRYIELIDNIWQLQRVHNSDDFEFAVDTIVDFCANHLPGESRKHLFTPGETHNYWIVPKRWNLKSFSLHDAEGNLVATHHSHPLAVGAYSQSIKQGLSLQALKEKTFSRPDLPEVYSLVFGRMYRHWESGWDLSLPDKVVDALPAGEVRINIDAEFTDAPMPLFELEWTGKSEQTVFIVAHLDHPGQVNDSLSGCIASLQIIENLQRIFSHPRFTYRVLLVPEIIGSALYLGRFSDLAQKGLFCFCPNMTSHDAPLAMCQSKSQSSYLDLALELALKESEQPFVQGPFHLYPDCGDEISFDTVGLSIPTPTLSRVGEQYPAYHTSDDNLDAFLSTRAQSRHAEFVKIATRAMAIIELNQELQPQFVGIPCLSHPDLDLYLSGSNCNNVLLKDGCVLDLNHHPIDLRHFMEFFLDALNQPGVTILDIAYAAQLPFGFVEDYAKGFMAKQLVRGKAAWNRMAIGHVSSVNLRPPQL